jgi:mannose-6-phosphate isomerase-like protein (cupin superfamily)
MQWCLPPGAAPLFGAERGCDAFEQRLLTFNGGEEASESRTNEAKDEVLYVLCGSGEISIGEARARVEAGTAAYISRGTPWEVAHARALEVLSVLVRDPKPGARHAVIQADAVQSGAATSGRSFHLLASPAVGCESVTQFIGLVPPGRAPDHFHRYDEVIYVLDGEGVLEIGGEQAPIQAGTCIHLPRTLVHCLANTGESDLRLLGVFTPAGSPAEAYYPDGTLAALPERN